VDPDPSLFSFCSQPTFASVVALLNDYRLSKGQTTLGFLNPLIYKKLCGSKGLYDITVGSNKGCSASGFPAKAGESAT